MILAQYNILGFYDSLEARAWNKLMKEGNYEVFRVFLETNHIPAIGLIVNTSTTATIQLLDETDSPVGSPLSMTVESQTGYKIIKYLGTVLSGNEDGDYSLKITNGAYTYYSDVFGWTSNSDKFSELVKVTATSSNIKLGQLYVLNLTGFTFECYLNTEYMGLRPEFKDDVSEKGGATNVLYGNLIPAHEFNIDAAEYIYRFLLGLRILEVNGTVTVTYEGLTYTATDNVVEIDEEHIPGMAYQLKLSFVDKNEIVSAINEIN